MDNHVAVNYNQNIVFRGMCKYQTNNNEIQCICIAFTTSEHDDGSDDFLCKDCHHSRFYHINTEYNSQLNTIMMPIIDQQHLQLQIYPDLLHEDPDLLHEDLDTKLITFEEVSNLRRLNMKWVDIQQKLGCCRKTLYNWRQKNNFSLYYDPLRTDLDDIQLKNEIENLINGNTC